MAVMCNSMALLEEDNPPPTSQGAPMIAEKEVPSAVVHASSNVGRACTTAAVYLYYLVLGVLLSLLGPALVSLEILFDTDTTRMSTCFVVNGIGAILASILCGFVYSRVNKEWFFLGMVLLYGISTAAAPLAGHLYGFLAAISLAGFARGCCSTASRPYVLAQWTSHPFQKPILQGMFAMVGVGGIVGPLMVEPFLLEVNSTATECSNQTNLTGGDWTPFSPTDTTNSSHDSLAYVFPGLDDNATLLLATTVGNHSSPCGRKDFLHELDMLKYVFLLPGSTALLPASMFLLYIVVNSISDKCSKNAASLPTDDVGPKLMALEESGTNKNLRLRLALISLFCLQASASVFMEWVTNNFLSSFVVRGLGWNAEKGAVIMSVFWMFFTGSRLLAVALSAKLSPRQLLVVDIILVAASSMMMVPQNDILMWIAAAVAGLGISSMFGSSLLLTNEHVEIDGPVSAVYTVSIAAFSMSGLQLAGYLFQAYGHFTLVYLVLGSNVILALTLVGVHILTKNYPAVQNNTK